MKCSVADPVRSGSVSVRQTVRSLPAGYLERPCGCLTIHGRVAVEHCKVGRTLWLEMDKAHRAWRLGQRSLAKWVNLRSEYAAHVGLGKENE